MALTWNWKDKIGTWTEVIRGQEHTFNIYKCNGLAVILNEYKENDKDYYTMHSFFADKEHLKNMLGTGKNSEHINYFNDSLIRIELKECKESKYILTEMIKAKWTNPIQFTLIPDCPFNC